MVEALCLSARSTRSTRSLSSVDPEELMDIEPFEFDDISINSDASDGDSPAENEPPSEDVPPAKDVSTTNVGDEEDDFDELPSYSEPYNGSSLSELSLSVDAELGPSSTRSYSRGTNKSSRLGWKKENSWHVTRSIFSVARKRSSIGQNLDSSSKDSVSTSTLTIVSDDNPQQEEQPEEGANDYPEHDEEEGQDPESSEPPMVVFEPPPPVRRVQFGTVTTHHIETLVRTEEHKHEIWYTSDEHKELLQYEVQANIDCEIDTNPVHDNSLSWRGLEHVRTGQPKSAKIRPITQAIVKWNKALLQTGCCDPEELREISIGMTKEDIAKSVELGQADYEDVLNILRPKRSSFFSRIFGM